MTPRSVPQSTCDSRHKTLMRWMTLTVSLMGIMFAAVMWSVKAGYSAQSELGAHEAGQTQMEKRWDSAVDGIKTDVAETREDVKEVRRLVEELWKKNGGH